MARLVGTKRGRKTADLDADAVLQRLDDALMFSVLRKKKVRRDEICDRDAKEYNKLPSGDQIEILNQRLKRELEYSEAATVELEAFKAATARLEIQLKQKKKELKDERLAASNIETEFAFADQGSLHLSWEDACKKYRRHENKDFERYMGCGLCKSVHSGGDESD